ncbi:MAG: cation-transporting P-type ATPase [Candidatus Nanohaloarchaea archaeon]|nr:cation-transporting P-type ATPase [Candidatus Nanohaloarchaea archaeon]
MGEDWHSRDLDAVYDELDTSPEGLSSEEAEDRLAEYGTNDIRSGDEIHPVQIFLSQFQDFLVYLLVLAALVSVGVGFFPGHNPEYGDAVLIFAILILNGVLGFYQEYNAEKSIEALKDMSSPDATVMRDGEKQTMPRMWCRAMWS